MLYITTKKSDAQRNHLFCCDVNTVPCSNKKVVNAMPCSYKKVVNASNHKTLVHCLFVLICSNKEA